MTQTQSGDVVAEQWERGPVFAVTTPGRPFPTEGITMLPPGQKPLRSLGPLVVASGATVLAWAGFTWLLVTALGGDFVDNDFIACGVMLVVAIAIVWHLSRRAKALLRQRRAAILLRSVSVRTGLVAGFILGFGAWLTDHPTFWDDLRNGWENREVAVPFLMLSALVGWVALGLIVTLFRFPGAVHNALTEQALISGLRAGREPRGGVLRVDQTCHTWIRGDAHIHGSVAIDAPHPRTISVFLRSSPYRVPINGSRVRVYTDGVSHYVELDPAHPPQFAPDDQYAEPEG